MSWATSYIQKLQEGETIQFRPRGNSMVGLISSGQLVTVMPATPKGIEVGAIVLCKVGGAQYLHKVTAQGSDGRWQIGNNKGHINGWTLESNIYGIVTKVED